MRLHRAIAIAFVTSLFLLPATVWSQEKKPAWELGVGVGLLNIPDYRGSSESRFYTLPYPYIIYRGETVKVDRQTIYGKIFRTDRVLLDVSYYGSVPVDSDKNTARTDMPDLDATFEVGPALDIRVFENRENQWTLKFLLPVRPVFSTDFSSITYEGGILSPRLNFEKADIIPNTGVKLSISAGAMFANAGYHGYYYTVKPAYATPSRPAYKAGGGYSGSTFTVALGKSYKRVNINAFVSADLIDGAVFENSPLVKTKTSIMSGVSVSWVFFKSAKKVTTDELEEIRGSGYERP